MLIYAQGGRLGNDSGGIVLPDFFSDQGVIYTGRRPCLVWYRGDLYVIGYYTRPVVRFRQDNGGWQLAGIKPPTTLLSVVPGASSGGSEGACLAAITFLHKVGSVVLAESDFGNVVDVGELTGEGRIWSGIDFGSAEARVTHVRGYVSMDGAEFRAAWEAPYGITAYVENVRTAQLTYVGPNYDHGIPPDTRFGAEWQGRMWYASSPKHPYRLWYSKGGFPQYVAPASFRDTLGKEEITGIAKGRNELVVFCLRNSYMIRQFGQGEDDFVMEKLDSDVGCLTHFGIFEIHNKLWFPSEDGPWIYDGGFRYLGKEIQPLWRSDYESNKAEFLSGFAWHDRVNKVYGWVTRRPGREEFEGTEIFPGTVTYCGYYGEFEPSMGGQAQHPEWTIDLKYRFDSSAFYNEEGELVLGSCDGVIRKQDWTDGDDDGDTLQKPLVIRSGHQLFFEPGDDWEFGKELKQTWMYVESESTAWSVYIRGGDEQVWKSRLPDNIFQFWKSDVAATASSETRTLRTSDGQTRTVALEYVPATTHFMIPAQVTGRGFTWEVRATAPVGLQYRGFGGLWAPGPGSTRPAADITRFTVTLEWSDDAGSTWNAFPLEIEDTAGPSDPILVRATLVYQFGAPTYPITVRFVETAFTETVVIAALPLEATAGLNPDPPVTAEWIFTVPSSGTVYAEAEDAAGVEAASATETLTLTET